MTDPILIGTAILYCGDCREVMAGMEADSLDAIVTPPGGTVLDPFMGSGSTGKAACLENFQFVGIDLEPEYVEIAKARLEHIQCQQGLFG